MARSASGFFASHRSPVMMNHGAGTSNGLPRRRSTIANPNGVTEPLKLRQSGGMSTNHCYDARTIRLPKGPSLIHP